MVRGNIVIHLFVFCLVFSLGVNSSYAADYYANPWNFQNLIDNAHDGDNIWFGNGVYDVDSTIKIYSSLKLIAENPGGAVLKAVNNMESVIKVYSPEVTVSGFNIDGNGQTDFGIWGGWGSYPTYNGVFSNNNIYSYNNYAIMMDKSAYSVFENNAVSGGRLGIAVDNSPYVTYRNNRVSGVQNTGLYLFNSPLSTVSGNTVTGCGQDGILLENSGLTMINNNNANNNAWSGIGLNGCSYSVILDNTATGNHGDGIGLLSSDGSFVVINKVTGNGLGIGVINSKDNNITDNNVTHNSAGIQITDYTNNVARNIITNNTEYGLSLVSNGNSINTSQVTDNLILSNGYGIEVAGNGNNIQSSLLDDNWILNNEYMLRILGSSNILNSSTLFGNNNGLLITGDNNLLSNLTTAYNHLTGIIINGNGNTLNSSLMLNNTNGVIVNGFNNNISDNYVLNNTGNGINVPDSNPVTGNVIIQNNGSGLVLRTNNNNLNFTQVAFNILMNNNQSITIRGNGNNITPLLFLLNVLLNNNCTLLIQGNGNNLNDTSISGNQNGIQIKGNQNSLNNVTTYDLNQTGIIVEGTQNRVNNSNSRGNQNGLEINGDQNTVNNTTVNSNQNGITVNGSENNLTQNNIQNNNYTGIYITGNENNLTQNNITDNQNGVIVNGTNNTLNYNRISQNSENNLQNNGNGTVNAQYNWWGRNYPARVTESNVDTDNYVVATQTVNGADNGVINTGEIYDVFINLVDNHGTTLQMAIPEFLIHFYLDDGDVYPNTATITNNSAHTQIQIFHPGSYTLKTVLDEETLVTMLMTPVTSQTVDKGSVKRITRDYSTGLVSSSAIIASATPSSPTPNNNGEGLLSYLSNGLNYLSSLYKNFLSFITLGSSFKDYYQQLPDYIKNNPTINGLLNGYETSLAVNPLTMSYFMMERMIVEPHSNIWDRINPSAYLKFYGLNYENLDSNTKWWIETITGITPQGDMSLLNLFLLILTLAGGEGLGLKLSTKFLPAFKIIIPEAPFITDSVKALYKFAAPLLRTLSPLGKVLANGWDWVVTGSKLVLLNPLTWYETLLKVPVLDKLLEKKIPEAFPKLAELGKAVYDGPTSVLGWALGKVPNLSFIKNEYIKTAAKITAGGMTIVKAAQTGYQALKSSYDTFHSAVGNLSNGLKGRIVNEIEYLKANGLGNYVTTRLSDIVHSVVNNGYVKAVLNNPYTKTAISYGKKIISYGYKAVRYVQSAATSIVNGIKSVATSVWNGITNIGNSIGKTLRLW